MEPEGGHRNSVIKRRNPIEFGTDMQTRKDGWTGGRRGLSDRVPLAPFVYGTLKKNQYRCRRQKWSCTRRVTASRRGRRVGLVSEVTELIKAGGALILVQLSRWADASRDVTHRYWDITYTGWDHSERHAYRSGDTLIGIALNRLPFSRRSDYIKHDRLAILQPKVYSVKILGVRSSEGRVNVRSTVKIVLSLRGRSRRNSLRRATLTSIFQKLRRVNWCRDMMQRFAGGDSNPVCDMVTGDKSWIYCYDTETKRQSAQWFLLRSHLLQYKRGRSVGKNGYRNAGSPASQPQPRTVGFLFITFDKIKASRKMVYGRPGCSGRILKAVEATPKCEWTKCSSRWLHRMQQYIDHN
ncbi:hypothetical protein EVAR_45802_1 [Eumeta japonica]|uniref:Uncharacterized protein n=1 Tax=Eumeta variegata TaxID=151549 RepID=A0A4C1X429_EUMVA|nr:hypothetical protein EVAR_45802_1 [Eumeta japonica]